MVPREIDDNGYKKYFLFLSFFLSFFLFFGRGKGKGEGGGEGGGGKGVLYSGENNE